MLQWLCLCINPNVINNPIYNLRKVCLLIEAWWFCQQDKHGVRSQLQGNFFPSHLSGVEEKMAEKIRVVEINSVRKYQGSLTGVGV